MKVVVKKFRVSQAKSINLKDWPTEVKPLYRSKKEYHKILSVQVDELRSLQQVHYASDRYSILLIFQGMGAIGMTI